MVSKPIAAARSPHRLAEPLAQPGVIALLKLISPLYLHGLLGFRSVELRHAERLVEAYRAFFSGEARLIVAFRHPYGDEAQLMAYVIGRLLAREAAALGVRYPREPHALFVHGYEVPLWGGPFERWLLPRVGAVPVHHALLDRKSVERIRALMADGDFPLALAPEGQVSYTSEGLPRLEPGAARICAWCAEDLAAAGRKERIVILPISVHHRWDGASEANLDRLIDRIEKMCGIAPGGGRSAGGRQGDARTAGGGAGNVVRFQRLNAIADAVLEAAERHYGRFCGLVPPGKSVAARSARLAALREAALASAERALRLVPEGDAIARVYRIRHACWDRIYRADIPDLRTLSDLERSLADRAAGEAWYASRHMELVDLAYYLDFDRLREGDPLSLFIETAQNYYDLISRLEGGNISDRVSLRGRDAAVIVGEPLDAGEILAAAGSGRKEAAARLSARLEKAYLDCIQEFQEERHHG
ncbi:hypothetical protein LWX53_01145 [bacterium]|nr:hypothetical protein [bacterium]